MKARNTWKLFTLSLIISNIFCDTSSFAAIMDFLDQSFVYSTDSITGGNPSFVADRISRKVATSWQNYSVQTNGTNGTHWLKVDLGSPREASHFSIHGYPNGSHKPSGTWYLEGSNNDTTWATLWSGDTSRWTADQLGSYIPRDVIEITSPDEYQLYRVRADSWTNGRMLVTNWSLFEHFSKGLVQPVDAVGSTSWVTSPNVYSPRSVIDGSNLSSSLFSSEEIPAVYPAHSNTNFSEAMWLSQNGDVNASIVFDLGAITDINGFHVWNFNESDYWRLAGMRDVTVTFSTTSPTSGFGEPEIFTGANEFALAPTPGTQAYLGEDKFFQTTHQARWVKFQANSNWGRNATGLSEIRFFAVPEPSTLLLGVLIGLTILARSRQRCV